MSVNEDDNDENTRLLQDAFGETAHQACYIFQPLHRPADVPIEHPAKRRKTSKSVSHVEGQAFMFPPLFDGKEDRKSSEIRGALYHELWSYQQRAVDKIVKHVNAKLLADIIHFVKDASLDEQCTRIPTGLVLTGPNYGLQGRLLEYWRTSQVSQVAEEVITLENGQAPNLTTALKNIIRSVIVQRKGAEWYQSFLLEQKRLIPFNYDLELLELFIERDGLKKIVVSILDAEGFDVNALSDLIEALSSWIDRLPIVLLVGIATTTELFEARLPKATVKRLDGTIFDVSPPDDSLYKIYQTVQDDPASKIWLGPALSSTLSERPTDQDESPESFAACFRYMYMSHFFANPLTVLLADSWSASPAARHDICNAVRNADSFHTYVESLLEASEAAKVQQLLSDDAFLLDEAMRAVAHGQQAVVEFRRAVQYFMRIYRFLKPPPPPPPPPPNTTPTPFEIDIQVFSGTAFLGGSLYTETLASLERLPSDALENLLTQCPIPDSATEFSTPTTLSTLQALHEARSGIPIRGARDPKHTTTSTTISRNNTVSLAKHTPKLSKLEKEYTALVQHVHRAMRDYFEARIIDVNMLFMNEAFVYDLKMPLAGAFTPRPRHSIQRALDRPGDYLGCECCTADAELRNHATSDGLPLTSLLWQLWCEAGSLVNVRDLWEAFSTAIVDRGDDDEGKDERAPVRPGSERDSRRVSIDERMALALFYRSIAELRMLGFVKPTKKKVDCLAKAAWKGL